MVVVLSRRPLDIEAIEGLCNSISGAVITNYNSPTQIIVGGFINAVDKVTAEIEEKHLGRLFPLATEGAYHSPCMEQAEGFFGEFVDGIEIKDPSRPFIGNQGQSLRTADDIREEFVRGIARPVVWWKRSNRGGDSGVIPELVSKGVERFIEVGPGEVLRNLLPRDSHSKRKLVGGIAVASIALYTFNRYLRD